MRTRKHHNNIGTHQVKSGKTELQVKRIAHKLNIPYGGGGQMGKTLDELYCDYAEESKKIYLLLNNKAITQEQYQDKIAKLYEDYRGRIAGKLALV